MSEPDPTSQPAKAREGQLALQTVPRVGAPPLRFKGSQVVTYAADPLFITLWARRKGDFVVAYSYCDEENLLPHAFVAADIEEASELLESLCDAFEEPLPPLDAVRFGALFYMLGHRQRFAHLVGRTLAAWETLDLAQTPEPV